MLAVDDIIVFPFKSLLMVFREIYNAAVQEMKQEGDRIRLELGQLYLSLEAGNIDEATFDERERVLLDRLDELEAQQAESEGDEEDTSGAEEQEQERRTRTTTMVPTCIYSLQNRKPERRSGPPGIDHNANQENRQKRRWKRSDLRDKRTNPNVEERSSECHKCTERCRGDSR